MTSCSECARLRAELEQAQAELREAELSMVDKQRELEQVRVLAAENDTKIDEIEGRIVDLSNRWIEALAERDRAVADLEQARREFGEWSNTYAALLPDRYDGEESQERLIELAIVDLLDRADRAEAALREAVEMLERCRAMLRSLPADALGTERAVTGQPYPIRDEAISNITKAIARAALEVDASGEGGWDG